MTGPAADRAHMRAALSLGRRHLGETWPNPSVGCVIVAPSGLVVGRAVTASGGRPHAETIALAMAGPRAAGATAYVTLEPCSHHGVTPPCTGALIEAGIARVVVCAGDPDPRVSGRGFAHLREAGLAVETGLLAAEGAALAEGFVSRIERGRPMLTLKLAASLDARIATSTGESRWITGQAARRHAHRLRAEHDAVMVGIGTALADDPDLTCRIDGARHRPLVRIVIDRQLRLPLDGRLAATAGDEPVWVAHDPLADPARAEALAAAGVRLIPVEDLAGALAALGGAGLTRVLCEGGAAIAAALLRAGLADHLAWFTAPILLGDEGRPAVGALETAVLSRAIRLTPLHTGRAGHDMMGLFARSG